VVGSTSLVGAYNNYRRGLVSIETGLLFGISSIATVYLTRKYFIPAIPKKIATIGSCVITENNMTMVLFPILMVMASLSMTRSGKKKETSDVVSDKKINIPKLLVYGIGIGFITGLLGAGGGFLLIPTLVLLVELPM
jgi:uncharacterized membrane protein YfcA